MTKYNILIKEDKMITYEEVKKSIQGKELLYESRVY